MVDESKLFASQVRWFSTLISKKENVAKLKKRLKQLEASDIKVVDMGQGQKLSRFVAWRFN
ncbi:ribosomal RNA large subunit methyltransferase F [Vibrio ishigakensis]|uniref:Ribosomal RNA large subunit methyltransferase F n=1 Tax=Vibrio ishigakensis TaxID=1481914 RepID=A0A0B8Q460_9VIBR|nr:ribosomal RNA large subunit methyltransferase F [Vibrio ishigakensis]